TIHVSDCICYCIHTQETVMSRLSLAKQTQIISGLVEGNSIRAVGRMTDTHYDTIGRLALRVGAGCAKIMNQEMRNLPCKLLQVDEIWAYVSKKQRQVTPEDDADRVGDFWTFVAMDAESKLVPTYRIGKRNGAVAYYFLKDLSERLANRVQLSSDAFRSYAP